MKQKSSQQSLSKKISLAKKQAKIAGSFLDEIKKIDWMSKREVKRYMKIVVASIFIFGFATYFIDIMFSKVLAFLSNMTSFFFG